MLVGAYSFRFLFTFIHVLHIVAFLCFHVGYGADWFEKSSIDGVTRYYIFYELGCLLMHDLFSVQICEGFGECILF